MPQISCPQEYPRRVSFDLSHNIVHLLPSFEQCRDAAKQKSREEWQRRSLNEDMLSEDIIVEIEEEWYSRHSTDSEEDEPSSTQESHIQLKSCLKKPPTIAIESANNGATTGKKKKSSNSKKNQKKRKRSHSKSQGSAATANNMNMISVH